VHRSAHRPLFLCPEVRVTVQYARSRRSNRGCVYPALSSSWKEVFSHLFPALRGLERSSTRFPDSTVAHLPARRNRTVTLHAFPHEVLPLLHFPKIAPSSLSNLRVLSRIGLLRSFVGRPLRLPPVPTLWFHATSPVCSSSILSALLQRLTTLGFIVVSPAAEAARSPRCVFCPSKLSLRR